MAHLRPWAARTARLLRFVILGAALGAALANGSLADARGTGSSDESIEVGGQAREEIEASGDAGLPELGPSPGPIRLEDWRSEDRPYWRRNLFKRVAADQTFLVSRWWPSELRRPVFAAPVLAGIAAASSSSSDEPGPDPWLERRIDEWVSGEATGTAQALSDLGNATTAAALIGATHLIGRWTRNERLSEASSLSAEVLIDAALWSTALKHLTARTRPAGGGTGQFFAFQPQEGLEKESFPSGHAMGAFAVATVVAGEYRDQRWVPWLAYGVAGAIGASRVALGRHFPSDVLVGALLGHSMGRMVLARRDGEMPRRRGQVRPYFDPVEGGYGLAYSRSW